MRQPITPPAPSVHGTRAALAAAALWAACLPALAQAPAAPDTATPGVAAPAAVADTPVQRGRYLATAGDCVACHTALGGAPMAGGLAMATPLGPIYSTNITPSKTHGIGNYTLEQFSAVLRHGKRADGALLYPAMPYTAYARTSDADIADLYAYFMQGVAPVDSAPPATDLPFPFIRPAMLAWNLLFHNARPYQSNAQQSPEWNRGAYLTQGLAHCGTCHTPRNPFMAEDNGRLLAGAELGGWYAPNITPDANDGIGQWSPQELVRYMRRGIVAGKATTGGPMAEAIDHSLHQLTEGDLHAIATYLLSLPAVSDGARQPAFSWGQARDDLASVRGQPVPALTAMNGAQLYDAFCASCHQAQGQGSGDGRLPALLHNTRLGHANTNNLVLSILQGVPRYGRDSIMPAFAQELDDAQVATLANYLLQNYGNPAAKVHAEQVHSLRAGTPVDQRLLTVVRWGLGLGVLALLLFGIWLVARIRR
ncbi:MAG: c-type cytochrome [Proteobacteria bacterium]|nr:c-type cytochrome [Pseudomonadota bacterium]MBS0494350.1 c-type cytochrome [Pseudomonadota bacterium]